MEDSDLAAIALAKAGNSDGFRILVDRYSRGVFRLAYRMTGNEFDAEDVVQETFLRAYRQIGSYESRSSFSTWLYRIAANYSLDLLRMKKRTTGRQVATKVEDGLDLLAQAPSPEPGPDRIYYSAQMKQRLGAAMQELSEQERTAFVLRHFEGMSIEEIGSILAIGVSATKNSIFRAVKKLRQALEPTVA